MVGQVVGAVAPVVVQSATNEDGLINRLFKIITIIAIIASIVVVLVVLAVTFSIWEAVGGTIEDIGVFAQIGLRSIPGLGLLAPVFTGIINAFAIRR